jgi:hypothetical protein
MDAELMYAVEFDGDDRLGTSRSAGGLYVELGRARSRRLIPLAFSVPDRVPPVVVDGLSIAWSRQAVAAFSSMWRDARAHDPSFAYSLPYASLRGALEVALNDVAHIDPRMGLDRYALDQDGAQAPQPFAYVFGDDEQRVITALRPVLDDWITHYLVPSYADPGQVPERTIDRVRELQANDALLAVEAYREKVIPWRWSEATGTAIPPPGAAHGSQFRLLADHVARLVAGREVFQGLGPMRRVITSDIRSSRCELVSRPVQLDDKGPFSLVLTLEVVTSPGQHQPLVTMDVSKRRWLTHLSEDAYDRRAIRGMVFSEAHPDRVFSYWVSRERSGGGLGPWETDHTFEGIRRQLRLPLRPLRGGEIVRGEGDTDTCRAVLTYREGLQGRAFSHGIKAGVPEADKVEAFDAVAAILAEAHLTPFTRYRKVPGSHADDDSATRDINAPTLLSAAIQSLESDGAASLTPGYLAGMTDQEIDALLRRHLARGLEAFRHGTKLVRYENAFGRRVGDQTQELEILIAANRRAVARLYPDERPLLFVFYEDGFPEDLRLLLATIRLLWGDALEIRPNRIPAATHGPADGLPGSGKRPRERAALREQAWRPIAEQILSLPRQVFCLVSAREYYPPSRDGGRPRHDDPVNKAATKKALASIGGALVQFLTPPAQGRASGQVDVADFLHRAQAAMRDLVSAHSGRVDGVKEEVDKWLDAVPVGERPKQIIGITIVRKNRGRARSGIGSTYLAIAIRLDVASGRRDMRCAYEGASNPTVTPWQGFPAALATISQVSPVRLGAKRDAAKTRFMRFVEQVISEAVDDGARPLVVIDSSNCASLWPWLADARIDTSRIEIGERQWMQEDWKGARIIRVRQDLAPGIVEDKVKQLAASVADDCRRRSDLTPDVSLVAPSSPVGLFRLDSDNDTGCVAYLSVGHNRLVTRSRGPSCFRSTQVAIPVRPDSDGRGGSAVATNAAGARLVQVADRPPVTDQWPTPNPLEIVVTLRQEGDDPDRLALLVESLRHVMGHYSEWTTLPAPLFFERVVRDYISEFIIGDTGDSEASDGDGDDTSEN